MGRFTASVATATPSAAMRTARNVSVMTITRRRSIRSTRAPDTSASTNHGRVAATVAPATSTGSRVIDATTSGSAADRTPSPMFEML